MATLDSIGRTNFSCPYGLINHPEIFDQFVVGDVVKIGFEGLVAIVTEVPEHAECCLLKVQSGGNVELNKALDVSNKPIKLRPFTSFDVFCLKNVSSLALPQYFYPFVIPLRL